VQGGEREMPHQLHDDMKQKMHSFRFPGCCLCVNPSRFLLYSLSLSHLFETERHHQQQQQQPEVEIKIPKEDFS
jgi:hypothetical protein